MLLRNSNEYDVDIVDKDDKVVFSLPEGTFTDVPIDVRKMVDWKIKCPNDQIIFLFDIFNDALEGAEVNLKDRPEYSYDGEEYITMNTMPHTIQ